MNIFEEGIIRSILSVARIAMILVPVVVGIEIARHFKILDTLAVKTYPLMRLLTMPKEAALPMLAGLMFGIILGAALIIDCAREGSLKKRDLLLIGIFLSISHSVIEDTLIFAALGANPVILLGTRFLMAVIITRLAATVIDYRQHSNPQTAAALTREKK